MPESEQLVKEVLEAVADTGDHFAVDVEAVVKGKVKDRIHCLAYGADRNTMLNRLILSTQSLLSAPVEVVSETAEYYKEKYD